MQSQDTTSCKDSGLHARGEKSGNLLAIPRSSQIGPTAVRRVLPAGSVGPGFDAANRPKPTGADGTAPGR